MLRPPEHFRTARKNLGAVCLGCREKAAEGRRTPRRFAPAVPLEQRAASWSAPALWSFAAAIPDLRPIEELLPPTFWEQHRVAILLGGLLGLAILAVAVWRFRRVRPVVVLPPAEVARKTLQRLEAGPDNSVLAGAVLKTLRHYLPAAIPTLSRGELTADEIVGHLDRKSSLPPELRNEISLLLRQCEQRQFFSGRQDAHTKLATRALDVIRKIEATQIHPATLSASPP